MKHHLSVKWSGLRTLPNGFITNINNYRVRGYVAANSQAAQSFKAHVTTARSIPDRLHLFVGTNADMLVTAPSGAHTGLDPNPIKKSNKFQNRLISFIPKPIQKRVNRAALLDTNVI